MSRNMWWLLIGAGILYWFSQQKTAPLQAGGIPCNAGFIQGQNPAGNWTCIPQQNLYSS